MEKYKPSTGLLICFFIAMFIGCGVYSCTEVKSYAKSLNHVPLSPVTSIQEITVSIDTTSNKKKQTLPQESKKEEQDMKEMSRKAERTFNDVAEIKGYLQDMTNVFLSRATDLRKKNDELITLFMEDRRNIQYMLTFMKDERTARIKAQMESSEERKYNKSSREATLFYANIFFISFIVFCIAVAVGYAVMWRKQQRVERLINPNHV